MHAVVCWWQASFETGRKPSEVHDRINMGGACRHKKKRKLLLQHLKVAFPIAAAAALPVFLEMAPSSGQQITEADRYLNVRRNSKKALMQLRAETLMLNKLAQNADFDDDVSSVKMTGTVEFRSEGEASW